MPSGPPELHEEWCGKGPTEYGDHNAQYFLKLRGYRLTNGFEWELPRPGHEPVEEENSAINYLIMEWDFGGLVGDG